MGMNDEKVYRIDKAILEELFQDRLVPTPASLNNSVDEVAWKKHHRYLTNVVDVDEKVVTWNEKGRKAEVLDKYYESLGPENCERIETVSMDGAKTYISSTKNYAINALIVLDRFPPIFMGEYNRYISIAGRDPPLSLWVNITEIPAFQLALFGCLPGQCTRTLRQASEL